MSTDWKWLDEIEEKAKHNLNTLNDLWVEDAEDHLTLIACIKEMRNALEQLAVIYVEESSKINIEAFKPGSIVKYGFTNFKVIEAHNRAAFKALEALKRCSEGNFNEL